MAEEEASSTESQSAVDAAMSGIPGLRESMEGRQQPPAPEAGEGEDSPMTPKPSKVEDSDAVTEALDKMPGLREKMGG